MSSLRSKWKGRLGNSLDPIGGFRFDGGAAWFGIKKILSRDLLCAFAVKAKDCEGRTLPILCCQVAKDERELFFSGHHFCKSLPDVFKDK